MFRIFFGILRLFDLLNPGTWNSKMASWSSSTVIFDTLSASAVRALALNLSRVAFHYSDGVRDFPGFNHASDLKEVSKLGGHGRDALMHFLTVSLYENISFGEATPALDAARREAVLWVFLTAMQIVTVARCCPTAGAPD